MWDQRRLAATETKDHLAPEPSCQRGVSERVHAWALIAMEALQFLLQTQIRSRSSRSSVGLVQAAGRQPPHEFFDEVVQKADIEEVNHGKDGFVS
jgi:hypothetical protein